MQTKLALAFFVAAAALVVCAVQILQIVRRDGEDYSKAILSRQSYSNTAIPFRRGTIMDRNHTVLASSELVYNLVIDVRHLNTLASTQKEATIAALVSCFGYDEEELRARMKQKKNSAYLVYQKALSEEEKQTYEEYRDNYNQDREDEDCVSVRGVWFEAQYRRTYPYKSLASAVLGFSGSDSLNGNWGIEEYYNQYLVGVDGREYGITAADGTVSRTTRPAQDGNTIISTVDFTIQRTVEDAIAEFKNDVIAEDIGVIVMDPGNGEILAMGTGMPYDLNDPNDLSLVYTPAEINAMSSDKLEENRTRMWSNFMVNQIFEPGSTAKVFTLAAALEEGLTTAGATFVCDGGEEMADLYVRCSHEHGTVTTRQAIAYSCNDAMMQLGDILGPKVFSKYQSIFGLGKKTGIDLPREEAGLLYSADKMTGLDLATNSFGQNFEATMIQMAAGLCSVINGGTYYEPHVVKQVISPSGAVVKDVNAKAVRQTVSRTTSEILRQSMELCVEGEDAFCTGTTAQIAGYTVGGKTGTAQTLPREQEDYLVSFAGFTTVEDPQVLVYVVVNKPREKSNKTSKVAIALERKIMASILDYMKISPLDSEAWAADRIQAAQEAAEAEKDAARESAAAQETADARESVPGNEPETESVEAAGEETGQSGASGLEEDDMLGDDIPEKGILQGDDGPPGSRRVTSETSGDKKRES